MKKYFAVICFCLLLTPGFSMAQKPFNRTISVNGSASEDFKPDIAIFSINITGEKVSRNEAKIYA